MIVLDTSAILAILLAETESRTFRSIIAEAGRAMVVGGQRKVDGRKGAEIGG